jgi:hypothetical protein
MRQGSLRNATMVGVCALVLLLGSVGLGTALAAESGPAWRIVQVPSPTNLSPGSEATGSEAQGAVPRLMVFMSNVGGATAGTATVTDTLPSGLEVAVSTEPEIAMSAGGGRTSKPCAVSGQVVTCEVTKALEPGGLVQIAIPLAVAPAATGELANQVSVSGGGAPAVSNTSGVTISASRPGFGFLPGTGLRMSAFDDAGLFPSAGAHPYDVEVGAEFPSVAYGTGGNATTPDEGLRSVKFALPEGLVVNPTAVPVRCTTVQVSIGECPVESQVGVVETEIASIGRGPYPLYSIVPPPGHPAELAYNYAGDAVIHILGGVDGSFHLTAESSDLLTHFPIVGVDAFLWGNPSDPGHDALRKGVGWRGSKGGDWHGRAVCEQEREEEEEKGEVGEGCSLEPSPAPFLTMPSSCTEPTEIEGFAESWLGSKSTEKRPLTDFEGNVAHPSGCGALAFEPTIESKATTDQGENPTGLDFSVHQPQNEALDGRATATLKDATVTLPEGMTVNPASANGLGSCSEEEMGYRPEGSKVRFDTAPQTCPDAAKVGTLEVTTPLLETKLPGSVYVAKPFDNPFGSLLAIYLAVEDEKSGIVAKLAGKVEPDPETGRLTARFTENPELPLEDIDLHFFSGAGAALKTPLSCGAATTSSTLTPWSTPEGADVHPSDSFQISGSCSASEAAAPKTVNFTAGTMTPLSGAFSPFVLRIARPDGSQHITGIETLLPEGLLGKLAGVAYCPESGIAQAKSRETPEQGKLEQASPSCPAASEVGTVQVTAGAGIAPIPVSGHAYLAGPYKGAPLSLVVIVPAVAGPFDLGTVVDRVALNVGEFDARIHAVADPLPTILNGIPLDVRSIELKLDRPGFTLNPTSCEAASIDGSIATQAGQTAAVSNRFQVGECGRLAFKPKLSLSLKGRTTRSGHPALRAMVTMPPGGANIARAQVGLPHSEFLDQANLNQVCTQANLKAGTCPAKAVYGHAKAWTPLLDKPLEGPVYLGVGFGYQLPAMVADLNGQIRVLLKGKVDTTKKRGLRNTFELVPDAPVEKFVLELKGGPKYGLLENSEDICLRPQRASAQFTGQNGKVVNLHPEIANGCKKVKHGKHKRKPHRGR